MLANSESSVLVLVDVQQKLARAMPEGVRRKVIAKISTLLTAAKVMNIPVIVTEQYPAGLGKTEASLLNNLPASSVVIEKTSFSCLDATMFREQLQALGCRQVIVVGMETHICILHTALALQAAQYNVHVVEDAVSSREKSNQYNALQRMRHDGVVITNVESVLFEWLGDARHPQFKTLAKLIA